MEGSSFTQLTIDIFKRLRAEFGLNDVGIVLQSYLRRTYADAEELVNLPARIRIWVRDHGGGVPDAALPYIFQPFYRVGDARDRGTGGVGLGLTIVHRTIQLHGGTVSAVNAPGGGLLVELGLPG